MPATSKSSFDREARATTSPNGSAIIARFAQRAAMIALAIIALATAGFYRTSISNNDLPTEYAMADTAIQNNLGE